MAVTEIAILHSNANVITEDLRQRLQQAQSTQEAWHATHYPNLPWSRTERGDVMFQQADDPAKILLAARWDSVPAHWEWIKGDENKKIMADLSRHIVTDKVVLFHLDAEIFSSPAPHGRMPLADSPLISVAHFFVDPAEKASFSTKFNEVKGILEDFTKPNLVRGAWRVDKEDEAAEEFVVFCGWDSLEKHAEFIMDSEYPEYSKILEFATGTDMKHYKRFL